MWEMLERDVPHRGTPLLQIPELVWKVSYVRILGSTHDFSVFRICCFVLSFCSFVTYKGERPRISGDDGTYTPWDQATTDAPVAATNGLAYTPSHHQNLEQNLNARTRVDCDTFCHSPHGDLVVLMRRCWVHEPAQRPGGWWSWFDFANRSCSDFGLCWDEKLGLMDVTDLVPPFSM